MATKLLSLSRASAKFGVTRQTIQKAIKSGRLRCEVRNTLPQVFINPKDMEAFAATINQARRRAGQLGGIVRAERRKAGAYR